MKKQKEIQRVLVRVRIGLYVVLALVIAYCVWRFDVASLPAEGCSPLFDLEPGDRIVVDRRPGTLKAGDAVLFRAPDGELYLGRVSTPPLSAPADVWAACEAGALWVVKEKRDCPGAESAVVGPIARADVSGRVVGLPW